MKKFMSMTSAVFILLVSASAQALIITSYEITNVHSSGFGGWHHTYTGNITPTGSGLFNYTEGSGTPNDGVIPQSNFNNQLFTLTDNSVITLHLSQMTTLSVIDIFGGHNSINRVPGTLTGATVTIEGHSIALNSINHGEHCYSGPCDDLLSLSGTILSGLMTDTIVLSDFQGGWYDTLTHTGLTYYNIGEITVSAIPEPETYMLLLVGLGWIAFQLHRRNVQSSSSMREII